jgi:hypothetical protein
MANRGKRLGAVRPLAEGAWGKRVWRPTFTVYITAVCDNLSSYLLLSTHSNGTYRGRKSVRRMGMGENSGRENGQLYGRGLEVCDACAFASRWPRNTYRQWRREGHPAVWLKAHIG